MPPAPFYYQHKCPICGCHNKNKRVDVGVGNNRQNVFILLNINWISMWYTSNPWHALKFIYKLFLKKPNLTMVLVWEFMVCSFSWTLRFIFSCARTWNLKLFQVSHPIIHENMKNSKSWQGCPWWLVIISIRCTWVTIWINMSFAKHVGDFGMSWYTFWITQI